MRATSQPYQVLRTAIGRTSLAALLAILAGGLGQSSAMAQSSQSAGMSRAAALQTQSLVFGQQPPPRQPRNSRNNPPPKKPETPPEMPELTRDKTALPPDYKVPPVALPELSISKELPIPDKKDKAAWSKHSRRLTDYTTLLGKGNFGDEKADRELLRYGITFRLNKLTQRNLLHPSDEERAKVVDPETTKPEAPETLVSEREKIIGDLRRTNSQIGEFQIRDAFLDIFVEEAPKLLDNNLYVRFHIGYLLATFNNREEDKGRSLPEEPCFKAIKAMINIVNDDKMQFECKIFPIRGLARCCRHKFCKPEDRFVIMETLIKQMAAAKTAHWWYGAAVAESLSQLGDPLDRAKNPAVAEALFPVIKDKAYADRVRCVAAHSLTRIPLESFKRTDEIAIEILRLGDELAQAYDKDPRSAHWKENFKLLYLSFYADPAERTEKKGLLTQVDQKPALVATKSVVNEAYQHLLPLVQNVLGVKGVTPIPDQLRKIKTWLDAHSNTKNAVANPVAGMGS